MVAIFSTPFNTWPLLFRGIHSILLFFFGPVPFQFLRPVLYRTRACLFACHSKLVQPPTCLERSSIAGKLSPAMTLTGLLRSKHRAWNRTRNISINSVTVLQKHQALLGPQEQSLVQTVCRETGFVLSSDSLTPAAARSVNGGKPLVLAVFSCSQYQAGTAI